MNGQLYHFPLLYPGCCFYDVLARYHEQSAHLTSRATSLELFGSTPDLRPSVVLPYRAERIRLWLGSEAEIREVRDRHSAWPYLQLSHAFPPEALKPIAAADAKPGRRKQASMISVLLHGLTHLRYCPLCVERDRLKEGVPYWHLVHQLYGVRYCPVHEIPLEESPIAVDRRLMKYITAASVFPASSMTERIVSVRNDPGTDAFRDAYVLLARTIDWLLIHGLELGSIADRELYYRQMTGRPLSGDEIVRLMDSLAGRLFLKDLYGEGCDTALERIQIMGIKVMSPLDHAVVFTALKISHEDCFKT